MAQAPIAIRWGLGIVVCGVWFLGGGCRSGRCLGGVLEVFGRWEVGGGRCLRGCG